MSVVSALSMFLWVILVLVGLAVAVVNCFTLCVMLAANMVHSRQNILAFHLIISDTLRGLVYAVEAIALMASPEVGENTAACKALGFFYVWTTVESSLGVGLILYDRLLFVTGPVNYVHRMSWKLLILVVVYSNFHAFMAAILPVTGWGGYTYTPHWLTCDITWHGGKGYGAFLLIWGFLIPAILTIVCYFRLGNIVKRRQATVRVYNANQSTMVPMGVRQSVAEGGITGVDEAFIKTAKILTAMAICFAISWGVYAVFSIALLAVHASKVPGEVVPLIRILTLLTSFANPLLYMIYNSKFRNTVKTVITCGDITHDDIQEIRNPTQLTFDGNSINTSGASTSREEPGGSVGPPSRSPSIISLANQPRKSKFMFAKSVWT